MRKSQKEKIIFWNTRTE